MPETTPTRVELGENDRLPDICGCCGAPEPERMVMLRLRRPILIHGRVAQRTLTVPVGYCQRCYTRLRRFDPAVQVGWSLAAALGALLLVVQLLLPRSDDVLALRAALPFAAAGLLVLAGLFTVWANGAASARFPVRLVEFGVHGYTLVFDNADIARAVERANRPTPAVPAPL